MAQDQHNAEEGALFSSDPIVDVDLDSFHQQPPAAASEAMDTVDVGNLFADDLEAAPPHSDAGALGDLFGSVEDNIDPDSVGVMQDKSLTENARAFAQQLQADKEQEREQNSAQASSGGGVLGAVGKAVASPILLAAAGVKGVQGWRQQRARDLTVNAGAETDALMSRVEAFNNGPFSQMRAEIEAAGMTPAEVAVAAKSGVSLPNGLDQKFKSFMQKNPGVAEDLTAIEARADRLGKLWKKAIKANKDNPGIDTLGERAVEAMDKIANKAKSLPSDVKEKMEKAAREIAEFIAKMVRAVASKLGMK